MEPKPESGGSDPMENLTEMSEPQNTAVLAYPVAAKSVYQLTLYPITLKVIISLSIYPSLSQSKHIYSARNIQ